MQSPVKNMTDRTMKQQIIDLLTYNEEGITLESLMMHSGATEGWVREVAADAGLSDRIKPASDIWYASEDEEYEPDMYVIYSEQSEVDVEVVDLEDAYNIFNVMVDRGDSMVTITAMPMEEEVAYHEGINTVVVTANGSTMGMTYTDVEHARQDFNALWVNGRTDSGGLTIYELDPTYPVEYLQIREAEEPYRVLEDTRAENSEEDLKLISELNALGWKLQKMIDKAEKLCLAGSDEDRAEASPLVTEYVNAVIDINRGDLNYRDHSSPAVVAEHAQLLQMREDNQAAVEYCTKQLATNVPLAEDAAADLADLISDLEEAVIELTNSAEDSLYECEQGNFNAAVAHLHEWHEVRESVEFGDLSRRASSFADNQDVSMMMAELDQVILESSTVIDEATTAIEEDGTEEI